MRPSTRLVVLGRKQLWTPAALGPSLALWLDADDFSTITLNGSTVSQWRDKSGNARHASQTTVANQPTYQATGLNGKPLFGFDGVNDNLLASFTANTPRWGPELFSGQGYPSGAYNNWNLMSRAGNVLTTINAPANGWSYRANVTPNKRYRVTSPQAASPTSGTWDIGVHWSDNGTTLSGLVGYFGISTTDFSFTAPATAVSVEVSIRRLVASASGSSDSSTFYGFSMVEFLETAGATFNGVSCFVVGKLYSTTGIYAGVVSLSDGFNSDRAMGILGWNSGYLNPTTSSGADSSYNNTSNGTSHIVLTMNNTYIYSYLSEFGVYANGTLVAPITSPINTLITIRDLSIGSRLGTYSSTSNYAKTDVSEVIVVNSYISTTDRQRLEGYLAHKWGLIANLPSGHPFRFTPPIA